jgi:hypothetical protein
LTECHGKDWEIIFDASIIGQFYGKLRDGVTERRSNEIKKQKRKEEDLGGMRKLEEARRFPVKNCRTLH